MTVRVLVQFVLLFAALANASELSAPSTIKRIESIESANFENLFALSDRVYSGSSPVTPAAFAELRKLGIKTVISVDGAKPEVQMAREFAMRYIHLPIGYNGTSRSNEVRLIKAALSAEAPLYIHCHHGKHRGPAAVALVCQGDGSWTPKQAVDWLRLVGTSPDYPHLFRAAANFKMPSKQELDSAPDDFPEAATVSSLTESMVAIDQTWENLKAVGKAGFKKSSSHPDLDPANEALMLVEAYAEMSRINEIQSRGVEFGELLTQARKDAAMLERILKQGSTGINTPAVWSALEAAGKSCVHCHRKYRN